MTSHSQQTVSAPFWGFANRNHLGGPALIAFAVALWVLFLGTVGAPLDVGAHHAAGGAAVASGR